LGKRVQLLLEAVTVMGFGRAGDVKPGVSQYFSVFMVKIMGVLCCFDRFSVDARKGGPDIDYDLCSLEVHVVFPGMVRGYSECWQHVIIPAA
jgi:hypothetical protein